LLLAIAALVVAALAGLAWFGYVRSREPGYDEPDEWDGPDDWDDGPPTQVI
jgi:hypothetical protein